MDSPVTLFRQLIFYLEKEKFESIVRKYAGNKYVKDFDTWSQFLVLLGAQIKVVET